MKERRCCVCLAGDGRGYKCPSCRKRPSPTCVQARRLLRELGRGARVAAYLDLDGPDSVVFARALGITRQAFSKSVRRALGR